MALDPILLAALSVSAIPVDAEPTEPIEEAALLSPDEAWNYDADPYPPCSMG